MVTHDGGHRTQRRPRRISRWRRPRALGRSRRLLAPALLGVARRLCRAGLLIGALIGAPWPLYTLGRLVFAEIDLALVAASPLSPATVIVAAIVGGWLVWAALVYVTLADAIDAARRAATGRVRLPVPLRTVVSSAAGSLMLLLNHVIGAFGGVGGTGAQTEATAPPTTGDDPPAPVESEASFPQPRMAAAAEATTIGGPALTAPPAGTYLVRRGDTLSSIAADQLGDVARWTDICDLNWHRHWPTVGGTLRDCDVIYPGWDLTMPAGPAAPSDPQPPPPTTEAEPDDPDGVVEPSTAPPADLGTGASGTQPATSEGGASGPAGADRTDDPLASRAGDDHGTADGIQLSDGSFIPWMLAIAVAGAAILAWTHHRRRRPGDDEPLDEAASEPAAAAIGSAATPPTVTLVRRAVAQRAASRDAGSAGSAGDDGGWWPTTSVGLVGDGADAAARALLVAALAGNPVSAHNVGTDGRGIRVVMPAAVLTDLCGVVPTQVQPWPALRITTGVDEALTVVDTIALRRARQTQQNLDDLVDERVVSDTADVDAGRPALLIVHDLDWAVHARMRASVAGVESDPAVVVVTVGAVFDGYTIDVDPDGYAEVIAGPALPASTDRIGVLTAADTVALLTTVRAAQTSRPPGHTTEEPSEPPAPDTPGSAVAASAMPAPSGPAAPVPPAQSAPTSSAAGSAGDACSVVSEVREDTDDEGPTAVTARLRVLGRPRIDNAVLPGRPLRAKAAELAVFLACHPDGADTATIADQLLPDVRLRAANQQVHTNASNLRHVLGRAGNHRPGGHLLKHGTTARYRLDPDTVDVDLWQLRDLLNRARLASSDTRTALLTQACALYTAPLAEGCDYDWVEPHRETARRLGSDAYLLLADDLLGTDPHAADNVLTTAIRLDRYNEHLYRKAMQARHALGDSNGIRTLLHALTTALHELDATPDDATTTLVQQLRADLDQRQPTGHQH